MSVLQAKHAMACHGWILNLCNSYIICCPCTGEPGGSTVNLQALASPTSDIPPQVMGGQNLHQIMDSCLFWKGRFLKSGYRKGWVAFKNNHQTHGCLGDFVTSFACEHSMWSDSFAIAHPAALLRSRTHLPALRDSCCGQWPLQDLFCRTRRRRQSHFFVYILERCNMRPGTFLRDVPGKNTFACSLGRVVQYAERHLQPMDLLILPEIDFNFRHSGLTRKACMI